MISPFDTGVTALLFPCNETGRLLAPLIWIFGNWFGSLPNWLLGVNRTAGSTTAKAWITLRGLTVFNSSPVYVLAEPVKLPTGRLYKPVLTVTSLSEITALFNIILTVVWPALSFTSAVL
ncbi:hypothetical protein D3C80_1288500 [compost metagenome]